MTDAGVAERAAALAARSDAAEKSQDMLEAVRLIGEALALEPRDGERRLRSAFLRTCVREYDEAREDLELAARDLPAGDPRPARSLALLEYVQGRFAAALGASLRLEKPFYQDLFLRGVVAAKAGREDASVAALQALRRDAPGWYALLDAYRLALRDDWAGAAAAAERAAAKPLEQPERLKTARAALTLKAWKEKSAPDAVPRPARRAAAGGRLRLISLGVQAPRHVTLDALEALRGCDVLFVNLAGDTMMDLIGLFCRGEIRPINFIDEESRNTCARQILAAISPGRTVGYATYGHVMMLGPLTMLLSRLCRRKKIAIEATAGVSIIDCVLADSGVVLGDGFGSFQLYDARDLAIQGGVPLNPRAALGVYLTDYRGNDRVGFYTRVQETLTAAYPSDHEALLWGADASCARLKVGGLLDVHRTLGGRQQLFVPALPRGAPGAGRTRGKRVSG